MTRYGVVPSITKNVDRKALRGVSEHCDLVNKLILDSDNNKCYRSLILSSDVKAENVLPVADHFGLSELWSLLEKQQEKETEDQGKLITAIEEGVEKLEEVQQHVEKELTVSTSNWRASKWR